SFNRPMNEEIENWHIVPSPEKMLQKALAILANRPTTNKRVLFCTTDQVAKKMMALFFKPV
ncbi:MAG: hypothetical protein ACXWV1_09600, partial [Chitinophagaceae bacterium]